MRDALIPKSVGTPQRIIDMSPAAFIGALKLVRWVLFHGRLMDAVAVLEQYIRGGDAWRIEYSKLQEWKGEGESQLWVSTPPIS